MRVFLLTDTCPDTHSDLMPEDTLRQGQPFASLAAAKKDAQDIADSFVREDEDDPTTATLVWSEEYGEHIGILGDHELVFLIREYDL